MSKIVLDDTAGGFNISKINANFDKIEDALNNKVLYRDNVEGEPNQMNNLLDMNSQRIINLRAPESANDAARIQDVIDSIHGAQTASTTPFTPNVNIVATTVQGAIVESDTENRALLSSFMAISSQVVNSISALRLLLKTLSPIRAFVTGYYLAGDGGGGLYYYDAADVVSSDNGGTIIVAADGGRWKLVSMGTSSAKQFGAKGDGTTNDGAIISSSTSSVLNIRFPAGIYAINQDYTMPRNATWTFDQGARLLVKAGRTVTLLGKIVASEDQWIFDCEDTPTNYSDPNNYLGGGAITTTTPIILGGTFYSAGGFAGAVSVKWFGATGAGFVDPNGLATYTALQTLPADKFTNDTKAIRFALTAICGDYEWIDIVGSQRGATGLFFPDGVYAVDDNLYFGGIAIYGRTPQSPILGCKILQVNGDKNLFVLQGAGRGGLGGGGSSSQITGLTLGYRFTTWQSAKRLATVYFVENKFNLDTFITNCRFSNIGYQQQVFHWDQKEARGASSTNITNGTPQYGYGDETGLVVTLHINTCMFDVGVGRTFHVGPRGAGVVEVNNTLFFDYAQGLIHDEAKVLTAHQAAQGGSVKFKFTNVHFIDIGQYYGGATGNLPNENFMYSRNLAGLYIFNGCFNENSRTGYNAAFNIEGGGLRMDTCEWTITASGAGSNAALFLRCNAAMTELSVKNCKIFISGSQFQFMDWGVNFAPATMVFSGNEFTTTTANCVIFANNPAFTIPGMASFKGNFFGTTAGQSIQGNVNPNILFESNIFKTAQDPKGISLENYGMKGRTKFYSSAIPTTGTWWQGDIAVRDSATVGQPKGWKCTVSGTPGTWVSEGNL